MELMEARHSWWLLLLRLMVLLVVMCVGCAFFTFLRLHRPACLRDRWRLRGSCGSSCSRCGCREMLLMMGLLVCRVLLLMLLLLEQRLLLHEQHLHLRLL